VQAFWLTESDRADMWQRRILAAELRGCERGRADGYAEGQADAEASMAASWRAAAYPLAQPDAYRREVAVRCVRAAEAGCRRDASEHERSFTARAHNTPAGQRSDVQSATVRLYPKPSGRKASAA
jgi:hypothetical protein